VTEQLPTAPEVLASFLSRRGLAAADGRPLYAYRCTREEHVGLQGVLERTAFEDLAREQLTSMAPLFVLYASDWWRRFHVGGSWKWESIVDSIDLPIVSLNELYPAVSAGLSFWQRPLLLSTHGRMFLVTLACEGGLPLEMLRKEGARLRRFFRRVLEDYGRYYRTGVPASELARRSEHELPRSWRQDVVFELGGKIIEQIWTLQEKVRREKDPIAALNRIEPDWRTRLPLEVSDDIAVTLLNSLVIEAGRIRESGSSDFRLTRLLRQHGGGWTLTADLAAPPILGETIFAAIAGLEIGQIPSRGQLMMVSDTGEAAIAGYVTELRHGDERMYRIERVATSGHVEGVSATAGWSIQFESAPPRRVRGGEPLSPDLPWVFGEHDEGLLRFVGQGSVKTRYPKCVIAISKSMECQAPALSQRIEGLDRALVETSADLEITDDDSRFRVRVAQVLEDVADVSVDGSLFTLVADGREVFHGLPSLFVTDADGRRRTVLPALLQWKTMRARDWIPWGEACGGRVAVRLSENGETRFQRTIEIVPKGFEFKMRPRSMKEGSIEVFAPAEAAVSCDAPESVACTIDRVGNAIAISLRCVGRPPAALNFDFDLGSGRSMRLPLPFPCRGARFVAAGENVLRYETCVYVEGLTECRVEGYGARESEQKASDQFVIEGLLEAKDVPADVAARTWTPLPYSATGRQVLELRTMVRPVRDLLSQTSDLDAYVSLRIEGPDVRHEKIFVKRYDRIFDVSTDGVAIRDETDKHSFFDADRYRVEAVRLWDPVAGRVQLDFNDETHRWVWAHEGREPGPWLLIGFEGAAARVRPALQTVEGPFENRSALQMAICLSWPELKHALRQEVERLVLSPLDPDWQIISATLRLAKDVPPTSLLVGNAVAALPEAAVLALIHAGEERSFVWDVFESLPFEWFLVPVDAWLGALGRYAAELNRIVGDAAPDLATGQVAAVIGFLEGSSERLFMKSLVELLRWRCLAMRPDGLLTNANDRRSLGNELRALRQVLLSQSTEKTWPNGATVRRWLEATHTGTVRALLLQSEDMPAFRKLVLTAPILAADAAVAGRPVDRDTLFEIRLARRFDSEWFDRAYAVVLQMLLADKISSDLVMV
jgi:hypothetical protein